MNKSDKDTILVVDDERGNRAILTDLLGDNYKLILAKNGTQALVRAREHLPDLILLDVLMPEMNGHQLIKVLKQDDVTRHIPVIFISALDSVGDEERGLELGAVDYITKPFHPAIVKARVRNHLQAFHQRQMLERLANIDPLTGIPNRRHFEETLKNEARRCARTGIPLSLVMVDVDYFKDFNDHYGHGAGDLILRNIAKTIQGELNRPGDFVARYGGEEFVLVLPEIDVAGGQIVTEKIRAAVEALQEQHARSDVSEWITVSLGGATVESTLNQAEVGELLQMADRRLYEAKRQGRNCVVWDQ